MVSDVPVSCAKTATCALSLVTCTPRCIGVCSTHITLPSAVLSLATNDVYVPYCAVMFVPPIVTVPLKLPVTTSAL